LLGGHADAAVADGELELGVGGIAFFECDADDDLAVLGEFDGVVDEVDLR
jgi:hypothetical protein